MTFHKLALATVLTSATALSAFAADDAMRAELLAFAAEIGMTDRAGTESPT